MDHYINTMVSIYAVHVNKMKNKDTIIHAVCAAIIMVFFALSVNAQKEHWRPVFSPRNSLNIDLGNGVHHGYSSGINIAKRADINVSFMRMNKHRKYKTLAAYYTINPKNEWANLSFGVMAMQYNQEEISLSPQILTVWKINNILGVGIDAGIGAVSFKLIIGNFKPMRQYPSK